MDMHRETVFFETLVSEERANIPERQKLHPEVIAAIALRRALIRYVNHKLEAVETKKEKKHEQREKRSSDSRD